MLSEYVIRGDIQNFTIEKVINYITPSIAEAEFMDSIRLTDKHSQRIDDALQNTDRGKQNAQPQYNSAKQSWVTSN